MLTVYCYEKCSTCRKALAWLHDQGIVHAVKAIREEPPTTPELQRMLKAQGGVVRTLFNTSGVDYRAQGLSATLPLLTTDQALGLLAGNGNLVKRPFVIGRGVHLVGFDAALWKIALGARR